MKTPLHRRAAGVIALLVAAGGCQPDGADSTESGAAHSAAAPAAACITPRHAEHFTVRCQGPIRIVETFGEITSFRSRDEVEPVRDIVVLVPRGESAPTLTGDLAGAHIVEVPVQTYAVNTDDIMSLTLSCCTT